MFCVSTTSAFWDLPSSKGLLSSHPKEKEGKKKLKAFYVKLFDFSTVSESVLSFTAELVTLASSAPCYRVCVHFIVCSSPTLFTQPR